MASASSRKQIGPAHRLGAAAWHESEYRALFAGQGHYLSALAELAPAVVSELEDGVLPIAKRITTESWENFRSSSWTYSRWQTLLADADAQGSELPQLVELTRWLEEWSKRWHLPDDWAKDRAINWLIEDPDWRYFAWRGTLWPGPSLPVRPYGFWDANEGHDGEPTYVEDPSAGHAFTVKLPPWHVTQSRGE